MMTLKRLNYNDQYSVIYLLYKRSHVNSTLIPFFPNQVNTLQLVAVNFCLTIYGSILTTDKQVAKIELIYIL